MNEIINELKSKLEELKSNQVKLERKEECEILFLASLIEEEQHELQS